MDNNITIVKEELREEFKALKDELKELASSIKEAKSQRKTVKLQGERTIFAPSNVVKWYCIADHAHSNHAASIARNLGQEFRYKHIAYCLAKGRKYEEIEQKVKEGNEPNWSAINQYLAAFEAIKKAS